ncbi:MAG: DUF4232 domain-containing protein [Propionibacteriaceae bacterium]|nr:MAG: DUF4232 domain-containing protein [Propionibacteriaceae bacterium]
MRHRSAAAAGPVRFLLVGLAGTALVPGCTGAGGTTAPTTAATPSPITTSSVSTSPVTTSPSAVAATGIPTGTGSGPSPCTTADLSVRLGSGAGAGMNQQRVSLEFTDTGAVTCTLDGHPGVSFVTGADGHQVGAPAVRSGTSARIVLRPGQVAHADLDVVDAAAFDPGACGPTPVTGLRVYPPDETASVFVPDPVTGCTSTDPAIDVLNVGPVQAGPGVSP